MTNDMLTLLSGSLLEEEVELSLSELCLACRVPAEQIFELVEEGIVEPRGRDPAEWRFAGISVQRVRCALRLERDLGVNLAGAALALDLLEEIDWLRTRLRRLAD